MEGHCTTGQSPQWAVVPMEEEVNKYHEWAEKCINYIWQYRHTSQLKHTPLVAIIVRCNCYTFQLNRCINFEMAIFRFCHSCIQWAIWTRTKAVWRNRKQRTVLTLNYMSVKLGMPCKRHPSSIVAKITRLLQAATAASDAIYATTAFYTLCVWMFEKLGLY